MKAAAPPVQEKFMTEGTSVLSRRFARKLRGGSMRAKKSPSLISPTGALKLMTHAMMGAALGLVFGLALVLVNPAVAALLDRGGNTTVFVFVVTLVTTFAIGATLTGAVLILTEDKES